MNLIFKVSLITIFLSLSSVIYPQWAKSVGGTSYESGNAIAVDASGNVYVTGYFSALFFEPADFDPGVGTANLSSAGSYDIFFAKYDSNGDYLWAKSVGGTSSESGLDIAVDASGNVYVTGYFQGTADFDPGAGTENLTSAGGNDIFFAKYDSNGDYLWAKSVGGTNSDVSYGIAVDASGNVYVTGDFQGTADFNPGVVTENLTSAGASDIFFAKYDSNGDYLWAKSVGGTSFDEGTALAVDAGDNVYVTGYFQETADFDPGVETESLTSSGDSDGFLAKYDSNGGFVWAKRVGGAYNDNGNDIAVDLSSNVYVIGGSQASEFGDSEVFFAKYDSNGDYLWAKSIVGTSSQGGNAIAVDASGNVYVTGYLIGTADYDPGVGTENLTSAGGNDIFFAKYNSNGEYLWAKNVGGMTADFGEDIAVDASSNVYVTGFFQETADFDPGVGTENLISAGFYDVFFAKYTSAGALPVELVAFEGAANEHGVLLEWETATEVNNYGFQVQRKKDKVESESEWDDVGFVQGNGTTNSPKSYSFVDTDLPDADQVSYRLKQIDNDGTYTYSKIVTVDIGAITSVEDEEIPIAYSLEQNYPNPFNPSTTIKFGLPENGFVDLRVYNILGQEVVSLFNQELSAGYHEVSFENNNIASGIYFYKLDVQGKYHSIKKMMLVK